MFEAILGSPMFIYGHLVDESYKWDFSLLELEIIIGSNDDRGTALDVVQEKMSVNWGGFVGKSCFLVSLFELEFELLDHNLLGNLG